jgi:hypothetical protein
MCVGSRDCDNLSTSAYKDIYLEEGSMTWNSNPHYKITRCLKSNMHYYNPKTIMTTYLIIRVSKSTSSLLRVAYQWNNDPL